MNIIEFGSALLKTGDLDPVYIAMNGAKLTPQELDRLCLAYWCFYSLGTAAYIAHKGNTAAKFWDLMELAAHNDQTHKGIPTEASALKGAKPWPRGSERRHFRGAAAVGAVAYLRQHYKDASAAVAGLVGSKQRMDHHLPFKVVAKAVESHPAFGPWMSFKIADMAERVLDLDVDFSDCALDMYKDPTQGAAVGFLEAFGPTLHVGEDAYTGDPWGYPITRDEIKQSVDYYVKLFNKKHKVGSLPGIVRPLNIQEIETIFCKYKSHLKGHYPLGKDTHEVFFGLQGWGPLADRLAEPLQPLLKQHH